MLRFLITLYVIGAVVFFVVFLVFVPRLPLLDAVVGALLWPWSLYKYFIRGVLA